jgi:hypothetical protein
LGLVFAGGPAVVKPDARREIMRSLLCVLGWGRDQKLQQITLSTSFTMIERPVMAGCAQTADSATSADRGDCGVRQLIVRGPMRFQMDWSFRKNIPFGGRRMFELSVDIFNPINFVQWGGDLGLSATLANWQPGLPGSRRTIQIGTRFSF